MNKWSSFNGQFLYCMVLASLMQKLFEEYFLRTHITTTRRKVFPHQRNDNTLVSYTKPSPNLSSFSLYSYKKRQNTGLLLPRQLELAVFPVINCQKSVIFIIKCAAFETESLFLFPPSSILFIIMSAVFLVTRWLISGVDLILSHLFKSLKIDRFFYK